MFIFFYLLAAICSCRILLYMITGTTDIFISIILGFFIVLLFNKDVMIVSELYLQNKNNTGVYKSEYKRLIF